VYSTCDLKTTDKKSLEINRAQSNRLRGNIEHKLVNHNKSCWGVAQWLESVL
jgi:hypothetical protein